MGTLNEKAALAARAVSGGGIFRRPLLAAAIGDSRMANSIQDQSAGGKQAVSWSNQGPLMWLGALTFGAVETPYNYIKAVSGATTAEIAAQVSSVLALSPRPQMCFINGGTNSFAAVATYAQVQQSLVDITGAAVALAAAGIMPVIETDAPRTVASWTANSQKCSIAYNVALRAWCKANGVRCADTEAVSVNVNSGTLGDPVSGYVLAADGIHGRQPGSIVRALVYMAAISDILPTSYGTQTSNPLDAFDATFNPGGNLLANGLFQGSGGTNAGSGASGTVAASWSNQIVSGTCTSVASKESPRSDGRIGDGYIQTISTTTASVVRCGQNVTTTGKLVAGDVVYGEVDFEITSVSGTVEYAQLFLADFDGSGFGSSSVAGKNTFAAGLNTMPTLPLAMNTSGNWLAALRGRLRTAPVVIGQGITSTTLLFRLECGLGATSGLTVKWGDATLRKA